MLNIACGFLYGLFHGMLFIILYVSIGLSLSFYFCRYVLTHNFRFIKNLKTTFETSEIIQALIKVLNSTDGYRIIFLSRLTPVRKFLVFLINFFFSKFYFYRFLSVYKTDFIRLVIFHFILICFGHCAV